MPFLFPQIISGMEGQASTAEMETVKQCVSILKRNVNRMGKTCKYEDGWSFTKAQGLKAQSS